MHSCQEVTMKRKTNATKYLLAFSILMAVALVIGGTAVEAKKFQLAAKPLTELEKQALIEKVPATFVSAQEAVTGGNHAIAWLSDGSSYMDVTYLNGIFTFTFHDLKNTANLEGKTGWGIYSDGVLAGFFDGSGAQNFFHGTYRNHIGPYTAWKIHFMNAHMGLEDLKGAGINLFQ